MSPRRAAPPLPDEVVTMALLRADRAERQLAAIVRQVERAARGNPERSATRAARKLLRQLTEEE